MTKEEAIELIEDISIKFVPTDQYGDYDDPQPYEEALDMAIEALQNPSAEPDIVRCKDCKYYSPMNRETKTGICNLTMHQNFGDNWFCAGAERRTNGYMNYCGEDGEA